MRIVSGSLKGSIISPPKNMKARPTTDIAKEGLFNILANKFDFEDLIVLDLFSGTGNITYEFASRGSVVDSVEIDPMQFRFIRATCRKFELTNVHAIHHDAIGFVKMCSRKYDIIFADPPYTRSNLSQIPLLIKEKGLLNEGGLFILEHSVENEFSAMEGFKYARKYGSVNFSFFELFF